MTHVQRYCQQNRGKSFKQLTKRYQSQPKINEKKKKFTFKRINCKQTNKTNYTNKKQLKTISNHSQWVPRCDLQCQLHFFRNMHRNRHDNRESIQWLKRCFASPFLRFAIHYCLQWCDHWISKRSKWANHRVLLSIAMRNNHRERRHPNQDEMVWFLVKL